MFEYPMHNFDVAPTLETVKSPNGARFMTRSVLVSPSPRPIRPDGRDSCELYTM
jgi:hypothetical protein